MRDFLEKEATNTDTDTHTHSIFWNIHVHVHIDVYCDITSQTLSAISAA